MPYLKEYTIPTKSMAKCISTIVNPLFQGFCTLVESIYLKLKSHRPVSKYISTMDILMIYCRENILTLIIMAVNGDII